MALTTSDMKTLNELLMKMEGNDFHHVAHMFKHAQTMKQHNAACALKVGDKVQWKSKIGHTIHGTVIKVNTKSVKVITDHEGNWSVSPTLLTKI